MISPGFPSTDLAGLEHARGSSDKVLDEDFGIPYGASSQQQVNAVRTYIALVDSGSK
jgi:hypothetical protein